MKLNCHCGAVEAEVNATVNELAKIVRCNCSICKRKNATMGMVKNEDFKVTKGQDKFCLLYTSPSPRDKRQSRMPSSA